MLFWIARERAISSTIEPCRASTKVVSVTGLRGVTPASTSFSFMVSFSCMTSDIVDSSREAAKGARACTGWEKLSGLG